MRCYRLALSKVGRGLGPAVNRTPTVLNRRNTVGADIIRPLANCSHYFTVGRGLDPAERPPLLGEGDRVSGGRVERV